MLLTIPVYIYMPLLYGKGQNYLMNIIIDAMGGDHAPQAPVAGAVRAVKELGVRVTLVGDERAVKSELEKYRYPAGVIEIVHASEVITNHEEPAMAVRTKKNSSVVVAARLLSEGRGDAMLSMGNTGALLAAGLLVVGRIKGILRPALAALLPSKKGPVLLVDAGANTNCRVENLVQFGVMGSIYMEKIIGIASPKVGIVSNGEEEGKGDELVKSAYKPMSEAGFNFMGNVEGRDVMAGTADVYVADGFVGNVILKTIEGAGSVIGKMLKDALKESITSKIGALMMRKSLAGFKKMLDYKEYGGAPLLGVKKPVIKGHGSSDARAVFSAIRQAKLCAEENICDTIISSLRLDIKDE